MEQILGLAQGDAQVGPAVAGQQAGARADVRAGQFQVAATLAGPLTAPTAVDVPAVAMPLDLGLRKIGHDVVFVLAGRFEITGPAMGTLLRVDIVFDEDGAGWGLRPKAAGVLTVFLAPAVGARGVGGIAARDGASAALVD